MVAAIQPESCLRTRKRAALRPRCRPCVRESGYPRFSPAGLGHRYYSPSLGKWISRDPIGEGEGEHLYLFTFNDPVGLFDILGLAAAAAVDVDSCYCGPDVSKWFYGEAKAHIAKAKTYQSKWLGERLGAFEDQAAHDMAYKWMDFTVKGCGTGPCKHTVMLAGTCVRKNQLGNIMFMIVGQMFPPGGRLFDTPQQVMDFGYGKGAEYKKTHPHAKQYGKYAGTKRKDNLAAFEIGMALGKLDWSKDDIGGFEKTLREEIANRLSDLTFVPQDGGYQTSDCKPCPSEGAKEWKGHSSFEARKDLEAAHRKMLRVQGWRIGVGKHLPFDRWLQVEYEDYSK